MPANPAEIASITANGQTFSEWEWVEFETRVGSVVAHLRVRVMEVTPPQKNSVYSNLKLKPKDSMSATLAGRLVMANGIVSVRQVAYNATTHMVEIIAYSRTLDVPVFTPPPKQYKNVTLLQFANAITSQVGVKFILDGDNLAGVDKIFPRLSTHLGETALEAIERAARFRNVHLSVDAFGNILAGRASATMTSIADLVEGGNITEARGLMSIDETAAPAGVVMQKSNQSDGSADSAADVAAFAQNPDFGWNRPVTIAGEMQGDQGDAVMRADFQVAYSLGQVVEAFITVPGWLRPDGTLWCEHLKKGVTIFSPMLFPVDSVMLAIRGVKHRQSNEGGTVSIIECCLPNALSAGSPPIGVGPPQNSPAVPDVGE